MHSVLCTRVSILHVPKSPTESFFFFLPLEGQEVHNKDWTVTLEIGPPPTLATPPLRDDGERPISKVIVPLCYAPLDPPGANVSTPWVILGHVVRRLLCTTPNAFCTILCLIEPLVPADGSSFCGDTTPCRGGRQVGSLAARPALLILVLGESRGHGKDWRDPPLAKAPPPGSCS